MNFKDVTAETLHENKEELGKAMKKAGYTQETLIDEIMKRLKRDNVKLAEFNKEQVGRIVAMYAAKVLSIK